MNWKEFYKQTKLVRELQREYFKTRSRTILEMSKIEEKKLDKMIADYEDKQLRLLV